MQVSDFTYLFKFWLVSLERIILNQVVLREYLSVKHQFLSIFSALDIYLRVRLMKFIIVFVDAKMLTLSYCSRFYFFTSVDAQSSSSSSSSSPVIIIIIISSFSLPVGGINQSIHFNYCVHSTRRSSLCGGEWKTKKFKFDEPLNISKVYVEGFELVKPLMI